MADVDWYDNLDRRLVDIENKVFGKANNDADYPQCLNILANLHTNVQTVVQSREKVAQVFSQLPLIEKLIDPQFSDGMTMSQSAKLDLALIQERFIQNCVDQLQQVDQLKTVFESQHIQAVPGMTDKLDRLNQVQLKQQDETAEQSEEIGQLLNDYNHLITTLSKQFINWDTLITEEEMKSQIKKPLD